MSGFAYTNINTMRLTTEEAIERLEYINGCKFSEQQLAILRTGNGIKIVACAGSGKTFSLVNLVTKRIMTGEIEDASKLLLTTYSKAGAMNMTERINALLEKAGYQNTKVEVRTLHSLYYSVLNKFGLIKTILTGSQRLNLIRTAVKNCQLALEEEDLGSLDSLFSYQVNNMLTNEAIYKSYVFDLDIKLEEYGAVLKQFAQLKSDANAMDFDDLQLNVYHLVCVQKHQAVLDYLHNAYKDIYVDEFQDTSSIQYKILQAMIQDSKHLVFVGDDDQCLVPGTSITMEYGETNIEKVQVGDTVRCCSGHGEINYGQVESIKETSVINRLVYTIKTESGNIVKATGNHVFFVCQESIDEGLNSNVYVLFGSDRYQVKNTHISYYSTCRVGNDFGYEKMSHVSSDALFDMFALKSDINDVGLYAKLLSQNIFKYRQVVDLMEGMYLCSYDGRKLSLDKIVSITKESYTGVVYDLNIKEYRNYIANGVVVHNCIYGWRGAKADILLNADVDYHIDKLNLDTNYRCCDTILKYAKRGIEHMSRREPKDMKAAKGGGTVDFLYLDSKDLYDMSLKVADKIEDLVKGQHVNASDICVLVRYNAHAQVLNQILMLRDIYCDFGPEMKLSYQTIYKDMENLVELCGNESMSSYDRNACSAVLWKLVKFMGGKNSALISEFMQHTGCSFTDALSWILANIFYIGEYQGNIQVNAQFKARMSGSFKRFATETVYSLETIYNLLTQETMDNRLVGLIGLYEKGMQFTLKKVNKKRNFSCYFSFFYHIAKDKGFNEFKNLLAKMKLYEMSNCAIYGNTVKLSTIHGAKGLEWKHVILLAYDNISFPDVDYMISKQDISSVDMQAYIDGERRLAYVGVTRAIETLTVVTDKKNLSLFGLEAFGACNKIAGSNDYLDFAKLLKSHGYTTDGTNFVVPDNPVYDSFNKLLEAEEKMEKVKTDSVSVTSVEETTDTEDEVPFDEME